MPLKVGMVSLGCPKNQVDAELLLHQIRARGYTLASDAALADVVVVNTCGFIESAKQESIDQILEFCTLKAEGKLKAIVVTGCLAERYREEIRREMPEVDAVVGIGENRNIADLIDRAVGGERFCCFADKENLPLSGERVLSTPPFYAYIKIAEGCSNCCTYCAIPSIRGRFRSRPPEEIVAEARDLAARGVRELIVVAQDTTRYGEDLFGAPSLAMLLKQLCGVEGVHWIRVLYCYPDRIDDRLIDLFATEPKLCPYLDLPLQHANGRILKAMNRHGDYATLAALIRKLRARIPNLVLRTTLIAGFPGETEAEFEELCTFVKEMRFERLGCFAYSPEEGTPAAQMDGQLPQAERDRRAEIVMEHQMLLLEDYNRAQIGKTIETVVEGYDRYAKIYYGRSAADAPEIDGKVFFYAEKKPAVGDFVRVRIQETLEYDLIGEVV